jgi:hypothetical protein
MSTPHCTISKLLPEKVYECLGHYSQQRARQQHHQGRFPASGAEPDSNRDDDGGGKHF